MSEDRDPRQRAALDPAAIAACRYCDEGGWLWKDDIIVGHCLHERATSDLTLDDVLDDIDNEGGAA